MSAPCRGRWKKETWTSASHFLNSQAPTPPHISCLFQTVSFHLCTALWPFFFYSFDFSSLDLISASPPTDPDPIWCSFFLFFFLPLLSTPPHVVGLGMENVGRRYITTTRGPESTHTSTHAPLHCGRFFHCGRRRSGWMRAAIFSPPFLSAPETSTVLMGVCIRKEKSCFFLSLISFLVQHFFSLLREKKLFLWKK